MTNTTFIGPRTIFNDFADSDFFEKLSLSLYKTAWSPLYREYVSIKNVRWDSNDRPILDCQVGSDKDHLHLFRAEELTNYVM